MKSVRILFIPLLSIFLSGCAGYRLGDTLPDSIRTVAVEVINETAEPSIEVAVMKALRAELQLDGRLSIASKEDADALLSVTLRKFHMPALSYNRRQGEVAEEYRSSVSASVIFRDESTGEVMAENPSVVADAEFPFVSDLTTSKRTAMTAVAAELARKTVGLTVNAW